MKKMVEVYSFGPRADVDSIPAKAKVDLIVKHVDNHARFWMNGNLVFDQGFHGDPQLNTTIRLNSWMNIGLNRLQVELINWSGGAGNPWHIEYEVKQDDKTIISVNVRSQQDGDASNSVAYRNTHRLFVNRA